MNKYLVLKATGEGNKSGRSAVVIDLSKKGKRSFRVAGNIPELYHGMTIEFELDGNRVIDYNLILDEKNIKALEKAHIDVSSYKDVLDKHLMLKNDGIGWNTATLGMATLYRVLPFPEADKVHKIMIDNANEETRVETINRKIVAAARRRRKIAYQIDEYLGYFSDIEQEGAYQQLMVSLKMLCLQQSTRFNIDGTTVWDNEMKRKEEYINNNIEARKEVAYELLTDEEIRSFIVTTKDRNLEREQLETLKSLTDSIPCVITGGAGVGKTTVIQTLIDCYAKYYSKDNVLLVAPTGKASRRLAEKTDMPASTIHRALRKVPEDDFVFYNEDNPLPHRLIIVDESSMIDTSLMYDLLNATSVTSKIIFVGDHNQLYPVGYGEPFFDFQKTLAVYTLTINHRQAEGTDILDNANRILADKPLYQGVGVSIQDISYEEIGDIISSVDNTTTQILSPYNALNAEINKHIKKGVNRFNVGDKVMTTRNTSDYCNGDIGIVTACGHEGAVCIDIDGREVTIESSKLSTDLTLAYAITIHKMQGSEADNIVVFIPKNDRIIDKQMMYTAVTRAKRQLKIYYYYI